MKKHNICFISLLFSSGPKNSAPKNILFLNNPIMDWDSAKKHCTERNWQWTLKLISQAQHEMEDLEIKLKKCEDQQKANRLYNACNY